MSKKRFLIGAAVILGLALAVILHIFQNSDTYNAQKEIAENIIRFHVRANSDSDEDQQLKLLVKDAIVNYLENELENADSLDEARNILYYDMDIIKTLALDVIESEGYEYDVNVYFEEAYFPMKTYGDMTFPPGEYEAFRVDIGDFEGKNWWCVLFPPLCFVDSTYAVVPDDTKSQFRSVLSEDAYDELTLGYLEDDDTYECRFKYLTFLNGFLD